MTVRTPEIVARIVSGLSKGTPLTVLCREIGICDDTVRNWASGDAELARDIAHAREAGFDAIAMEALAIADETASDTKVGRDGQESPDSEWISRSRLRVETRLKLLAKWDPKRYGDRVQHTGEGGGPIQAAVSVRFVGDE